MKNYHNIEKSAFKQKTYIGYSSSGNLFYITRNGKGWRAVRRHCPASEGVYIGVNQTQTIFYSNNMSDVSDMLSKI